MYIAIFRLLVASEIGKFKGQKLRIRHFMIKLEIKPVSVCISFYTKGLFQTKWRNMQGDTLGRSQTIHLTVLQEELARWIPTVSHCGRKWRDWDLIYSGTSENRLPLLRKPPQCGQGSAVPNCIALYYSCYKETSVLIKDTSEIRTLLQGPAVSLFQRFHCIMSDCFDC